MTISSEGETVETVAPARETRDQGPGTRERHALPIRLVVVDHFSLCLLRRVPSACGLLLARGYERGTMVATCPGCGAGCDAVPVLAVVLGAVTAFGVVAVDGAVR